MGEERLNLIFGGQNLKIRHVATSDYERLDKLLNNKTRTFWNLYFLNPLQNTITKLSMNPFRLFVWNLVLRFNHT